MRAQCINIFLYLIRDRRAKNKVSQKSIFVVGWNGPLIILIIYSSTSSMFDLMLFMYIYLYTLDQVLRNMSL